MIDLRLPIGLFFLCVGIIMTGFGLFSPHDIPNISQRINVDLYWGVILLLFGALMTIFGFKGQRSDNEKAK